MAEETKKIEIDVLINTAESAKSISEIRGSLKDLKTAALEFGEGTEGFKKATAAAGQLNDKLADVNGTIKTLSGNTTENLTRSFAGVTQAGVGGFQALIGAQALFGEQNEDLQKTLVQLQGVMAFSQGIQEFANVGQAAKDFKLVLGSLIPSILTKTAVTEADTVAQEQNVFALIAGGVASTTVAIKNGVLSASTATVTAITTAFGVASGIAWGIATLGVAALVGAIVGLIVYWDEVTAKVEEFGVTGKVALSIILGPLKLIYDGIVALGEAFGILDTEAEASAKNRAAAEAKYAESIGESQKRINNARQEFELLSSGANKIAVQARIDRERAAEEFITNTLKANVEARAAIQKSGSTEEEAVIKQNLDLKLKAITDEYKLTLAQVRQGEATANAEKQAADKKASDDLLKTRQDAAKKQQDDAAANAKARADLELKYANETAFQKIDREEKAELELAKKLNESEDFKQKIREKFSNDRKTLLDKEAETEFTAIVANSNAEKKIADDKAAKRATELENLKTFQLSVREIEIAGMTETDAALAVVEDTRIAERKQITDEFNALTQEEQLTNKQAFEDAKLAIDKKAAEDKLAIEKDTAEKQAALDLEVKNKKIEFALQGLSIVSDALTLFGKKNEKAARAVFNIDKALGIASATINTYDAATAVFKSTAKNAALTAAFPAAPYIAAGLAVASGLVKVAKIASTQFKPSGDGGAPPSTGNDPGPSGIPSPQASSVFNTAASSTSPSLNLFGTSNPNANNVSGANPANPTGTPVIRAYVTQSDIENTQVAVDSIRRRSQL